MRDSSGDFVVWLSVRRRARFRLFITEARFITDAGFNDAAIAVSLDGHRTQVDRNDALTSATVHSDAARC